MESHMGQGYKFQPSDELSVSLLKEKRLDPHFSYGPIKDIGHICSLEPEDLATESETESADQACTFSINLITSTGTVTVSTEEQKQGNGKLLVKIPKSKLVTALLAPKSS
ncbi:hypothetical protein AB3S75_002899 [Citrus x aurantiifolia]